MKAEVVLIQNARLQRPVQRALLTWLTFVAWLAWTFLWLPLITLLAWLLGVRTSYVNLFVLEHGNGVQNILMLAGGAALCMLIVLLWSNYNYHRFKDMQRRQQSFVYSVDEMAATLAVEKETAVLLRTASRVIVDFRDDGTAIGKPAPRLSLPRQGATTSTIDSARK